MTRLTSEWTETTEQAFGASGAKGLLGEQFLLKVFDSWGWLTKHFESDYNKQIKGIDIEFRNPKWANFYSCDVKNNLSDYGTFRVYRDWLFKIESDRVFHVNPKTQWMSWYGVDDMRDVYDSFPKQIDKDGKEFIHITTKNRPNFVTSRKGNV